MPAWFAMVNHTGLFRRSAVLALIALSVSCGPERDFTGVWQQTQCGETGAQVDCDGFLYELHIGRYGDAVSGVLVRYRYDESAFDGFRAPAECGCFLIDSGRAEEDQFEFRLYQPNTPRTRAGDEEPSPACAAEAECAGRRFILEETADGLVGETVCDDGTTVPVRFAPALGSPRTQCFPIEGTP